MPCPTGTVSAMTPEEIVDQFIAAIEATDVDKAVSMTAESISYENMPTDPIVGREAVAQTLRAFLAPATEVDWQTLRQWSQGRTVINERLDRFRIGDGWLELSVAGVFEIDDDDRIVLWRDYFDMGSYTRQLAELTGS